MKTTNPAAPGSNPRAAGEAAHMPTLWQRYQLAADKAVDLFQKAEAIGIALGKTEAERSHARMAHMQAERELAALSDEVKSTLNSHAQLTAENAALRGFVAGFLAWSQHPESESSDSICSLVDRARALLSGQPAQDPVRAQLVAENAMLCGELGAAASDLDDIADELRQKEINFTAAILERKAQHMRATIDAGKGAQST